MSTISLEAESRVVHGKGASRRLRRLENKIPAIVYGGDKKPQTLHLSHFKVTKALETESIYSSVFDLHIDGKVETVILKALQRHPYKPVILHMDFQRVSAKDVLVRMVPLHFINENKSEGAKEGGVINHSMTQVEIRCQAKDLPEFIEVDLSKMKLDDVLHLTDLVLPKNVELAIDADADHNHPVVSIHLSRAALNEENEESTASESEAEEASAESSDSEDSSEADKE